MLKRAFDLMIASVALLALLPVLLALAALVHVRLGSPILFRQRRPGLGGKPFTLYKFRTMTEARDHLGARLADGHRLTRLGRFLRVTSLDELPELINVLRGEMSLVGPRPLLMAYLPYYTERERLRHAVRPGITGWAQVNGRNLTCWDDRLAMDVWYVENWSLGLDLRILGLTVLKVVTGEGVVAETGTVETTLSEERSAHTGVRQDQSRKERDYR
jgi:lipopolysaccharide/colanic/teichoic acid biosynthesis glycosyltransferase